MLSAEVGRLRSRISDNIEFIHTYSDFDLGQIEKIWLSRAEKQIVALDFISEREISSEVWALLQQIKKKTDQIKKRIEKLNVSKIEEAESEAPEAE